MALFVAVVDGCCCCWCWLLLKVAVGSVVVLSVPLSVEGCLCCGCALWLFVGRCWSLLLLVWSLLFAVVV